MIRDAVDDFVYILLQTCEQGSWNILVAGMLQGVSRRAQTWREASDSGNVKSHFISIIRASMPRRSQEGAILAIEASGGHDFNTSTYAGQS
jgi:hypothetical protein